MKKIFAIVLAVMLSIFTAACGQATPTEVVTDYLEAIKAQDMDAVDLLYAGDADDVSMDSSEEIDTDSFSEELTNKLIDMYSAFEYSVSNETIDGDTATVDVTIKSYNIGAAMKSALSESISQIFAMAFSGASDEEIDEMSNNIFMENLEAATFDLEQTVTISLTKEDGQWVVDAFEDDSPFIDAITGGLLTFSKGIEDAFGN